MQIGNVYLVGFMGAGKTTVGMRLAELLQWDFIDLDREIERRAGRTIREIFLNDGEVCFRDLECKELERVSSRERAVIALGGGAFMDAKNRETVASSGTSVWLDAPIDIIYPRCADDLSRPLVVSREQMEQLLKRRRPSYQLAALRVEVDDRDVNDLALFIFQHLPRNA